MSFQIGEEVCIVDASDGCRTGPNKNGATHSVYAKNVNKPAVVVSLADERETGTITIQFENGKRLSTFPWRLSRINITLENE